MQALRIVLHQTSANYRKEETIDNKMTYPLPPKSTIMGALHKACGYKNTRDMKISIQGNYESMHREPYTDYCFLNSTMDDRGTLVYMKNSSMLSKAYVKVASAKKSQGNSFRKNITIDIYNNELLKEYQRLKNLNDSIQEFKKKRFTPFMNLLKKRKATLSTLKKQKGMSIDRYKRICAREAEIKKYEKLWKEQMNNYERNEYIEPISKFRSLTTSLKFYEVLDEVTLIIHVAAEETVLQDIQNNIYNLTSIGRSEDFVEVKETKLVELQEELDDPLESLYAAYINLDLVRGFGAPVKTKNYESREAIGTKYMLNGKYNIEGSKRIFNKIPVLYVSEHEVETLDPNRYLYADDKYIVNLLVD